MYLKLNLLGKNPVRKAGAGCKACIGSGSIKNRKKKWLGGGGGQESEEESKKLTGGIQRLGKQGCRMECEHEVEGRGERGQGVGGVVLG